MQTKLSKLFKSFKANTNNILAGFVAFSFLISPAFLNAATLDSLEVKGNKLILNSKNLKKFSLKGNNTSKITLILPETVLNDFYKFNDKLLMEKIQSQIPKISGFQVVQYSIEPAQARIIIKSRNILSPDIKLNEKENKVIISFSASDTTTKSSIAPTIKSSQNTYTEKCNPDNQIMKLSTEIFNTIFTSDGDQNENKLETLENYLSKNPDNYWIKYYLSRAYLAKGETELARVLSKDMISNHPNFFASYYTMGIINDIDNKSTEATKMYTKTIELNPEFQDAHYRSGLAYLKANNNTEAEKAFLRTLQIYPEHNGALQNLGLLYLKNSNTEKAKKYLLKSLRADTLNNMANIYLQENNTKKAIKYLQLAKETSPDNAIVYYNLGKAYQAQDKTEAALKAYKKALELDNKLANAHYNLAIIYTKMEENKLALNAFKEYLKVSPEASDKTNVEQIILKLEKLITYE